jgi:hypothetical protein
MNKTEIGGLLLFSLGLLCCGMVILPIISQIWMAFYGLLPTLRWWPVQTPKGSYSGYYPSNYAPASDSPASRTHKGSPGYYAPATTTSGGEKWVTDKSNVHVEMPSFRRHMAGGEWRERNNGELGPVIGIDLGTSVSGVTVYSPVYYSLLSISVYMRSHMEE